MINLMNFFREMKEETDTLGKWPAPFWLVTVLKIQQVCELRMNANSLHFQVL